MESHIADLIHKIAELPSDWHGAGSVQPEVLDGIARHAEQIGPIHHSVETGSGKTTLLFSHLSENHIVFAKDDGKSITRVKESPLFNAETVTYIEGATQRTLPSYKFNHNVQIALIDGPHGYPFPDLEYYYMYPLIETDGLLLVDDIQIPTITRMFEIIQASDMFELLEVVKDLAFFRRTAASLIDPESCSWPLQGYNKPHYEEIQARKHRKPSKILTTLSALTPDSLKKRTPERVKKIFRP